MDKQTDKRTDRRMFILILDAPRRTFQAGGIIKNKYIICFHWVTYRRIPPPFHALPSLTKSSEQLWYIRNICFLGDA